MRLVTAIGAAGDCVSGLAEAGVDKALFTATRVDLCTGATCLDFAVRTDLLTMAGDCGMAAAGGRGTGWLSTD